MRFNMHHAQMPKVPVSVLEFVYFFELSIKICTINVFCNSVLTKSIFRTVIRHKASSL